MIVSVKGKRPKGDVAKEMSLTGKLVIAGGSAIVLILVIAFVALREVTITERGNDKQVLLVISAHRQEGGRRP